jgi:subtilisin family serine protease
MNRTRKSRLMVISLLALTLLLLCSSGSLASPSSAGAEAASIEMPKEGTDLEYMPGQVIVKFREGTSSLQTEQESISAGVESIIHKISPLEAEEVYVMKLKPEVSVESAIEQLRASPQVAYADPNYLYKFTYTPNDPGFTNQWGYNNTGQTIKGVTGTPDADIDAVEAWNLDRGGTNPVTVAVLDTGIDLNHPDLVNKLWTNTDEIPNNGIDDDGNGYIDDVNGYNMAGIMQPIYDWINNLGWSSGQVFAQSIKGTGADLTHIGVALKKVGNPTKGITVSVRSSLGASDLASFSIAPSELPASGGAIIYKQLSNAVRLNAGSDYYIVVSTNQLSTNDYYWLYYYGWEGDYYAEGNVWELDGSTWTSHPTDDLCFSTNPNPIAHDDGGHGTHCCGIVGAETGNNIGVAGTSPGVRIMPVRIGVLTGASIDNAVEGIYYAADNGADIISMSFAGTTAASALEDAVNYAYSKGVTMFASAGNSSDSTTYYPAAYDHVIGVGATSNTDTIASFSTYNSSVDISAPGVDVYSTTPTYDTPLNLVLDHAKNYDFLSGTSMACPTAAGVGALVLSRNPSCTPDQVEQILEESADDKGAAGRDDYYGYGRVNAFNALNETSSKFTVTSISPSSAVVGTTSLNISDLAGANFVSGAKVRLEGNGLTINATNVSVVSSTQITCTFDLSTATEGSYDVVVRNPDTQEARLSAGFSVTSSIPCGFGSGLGMLGLGLTLGLLSLAGPGGILARRKRRKKNA